MSIVDKLNDEQTEAVNTVEGPLLVLAGAGSGKTRVVTLRIVNLLQMGVLPSEILGLTFTNKAAGEMRERIQKLTNSKVLISTFHSLGARILRESIYVLGYKSDFTIYDEEDALKLIRSCLVDLGIKDKKMEPKNFKSLISKAKSNLQGPDSVQRVNAKSELEQSFPDVYEMYQSRLKEYNAVDFDDLLYLIVRLFREHPEVLQTYQNRWSFLLIDEYQDTNMAQYEIVQQLIARTHNLCVVGDPDQSIYSWRGANIKNILNFEQDYPNAKVIRLERNYRSRSNILDAANELIGHNYNRYEKNLWSDLGEGEKIKHYTANSEKDEGRFVAEQIRFYHEKHQIPYNEMVVFYRTNFQSRVFEDRFLFNRTPYVIVGGISFYQRREIKDILSFLRMVHSGSDFISFARTINLPKRGIGAATIEKIRIAANSENVSIFALCEAIAEGLAPIKLTAKQSASIQDYVRLIRELRRINAECSLKELVSVAIEESGYLRHLMDDQETFDDRKGNLDELIAKAMEWELSMENPTLRDRTELNCTVTEEENGSDFENFSKSGMVHTSEEELSIDESIFPSKTAKVNFVGSLTGFLEELSLKSTLDEANTADDRVSLMTIHNGKGLEFTLVFLVGMEEDLFPHANSRGSDEALEEERRLCYVGMTRAKEYLYITDTRIRFLWGTSRTQRPSRFIKEIPRKYLERIRKSVSTRDLDGDFIDDIDQTLPNEAPFSPGDAVMHKEFGVGIIREAYQGAVGLTYKIVFSNGNQEKNIVAKYAHLTKL